jgi:hypothetical protein
MVHALHEAWRVLVPRGILIDVRPYCTEAPLEVVFKDSIEPAGMVDTSLGFAHDEAADQAISAVAGEGIIKQLKMETFDSIYYWKTLKGMVADVEERWKEDIAIPEIVLHQASILYKKSHYRARPRIRFRMKLAVYEKQ